jgi:hypothetical protein
LEHRYAMLPDNLMDFTNIHIDHIKPVSRFNFTDEGEELLDCCNYTNLQPLLAIDNYGLMRMKRIG